MIAGAYHWGAASKPRTGETVCGDRCVVRLTETGALVAMIDGLGHGRGAAAAAAVAVHTLERHAHEAPAELIRLCHAGMAGLRGAAISVASFHCEQGTMTWLGVGNVTGLLVYADPETAPRVRSLLVRGGTVGDRLPDLRASVEPIAGGDMLILASDGVREDFAELLPADIEPQRLSDRIIDVYANPADDAAVLVFGRRNHER